MGFVNIAFVKRNLVFKLGMEFSENVSKPTSTWIREIGEIQFA